MSELIVDIHPHIVSADTDNYPIDPIGGTRSDWSHKRSVDLDGLLASMDEARVTKAAVVHSSTTYGFDCDYVSDSVGQHPGRLTGVFSVNVLEDDAPDQMLKWYDRGLTGMRIFSRGSTLDGAWLSLDDPRISPCYDLAAERGISVVSNATTEHFDQIEAVLKAFPKTKIILDHLGKADFLGGAPFKEAEPLLRLARYPNLYVKVTTGNLSKAKEANVSAGMFEKLVSAFGASRIAWGSNFPASKGSLAELVALAKDGVRSLSRDDQEWILGKTALELYPALKSA